LTVLNDYLRFHLPSKEAAKVHVRLVVKEYSQLDEYVFKRQLEITKRGLYVAGFTKEQAREIMREIAEEEIK
jgi:hypothetical protein